MISLQEIRDNLKSKLLKLFDGFKLDFEKDGFSFISNNREVVYQFGGNFRTGTDIVYCDHLNAGLRFVALEEIITPILVETQILGPKTNATEQWTLSIFQNHLLRRNKYNYGTDLNIHIKTHEDLEKFIEQLKIFYNNSAKPFFTDWSSLVDFKDLIENLTPRETAQIFGSGGIFKKAVIYKMVNHKIYDEYIDKTIQNLLAAKESNPEEIQYQRFYRAALLTKERLASIDLPS